MELKYMGVIKYRSAAVSSNRTFMELKYRNACYDGNQYEF